QKVWPDAFVEEATLAQNIFTLRKHLRDDRETAQYIDTVPKKGYRFVAQVREINAREITAREVKTSSPPVDPTPRMPRRKLAYAVVVAVVLATVVGGWYWTRREAPSEHVARETQSKLRTLAVLPLRGLSDKGGEESWGIGMTDAIITRLTSLQN